MTILLMKHRWQCHRVLFEWNQLSNVAVALIFFVTCNNVRAVAIVLDDNWLLRGNMLFYDIIRLSKSITDYIPSTTIAIQWKFAIKIDYRHHWLVWSNYPHCVTTSTTYRMMMQIFQFCELNCVIQSLCRRHDQSVASFFFVFSSMVKMSVIRSQILEDRNRKHHRRMLQTRRRRNNDDTAKRLKHNVSYLLDLSMILFVE
jgi:hypothetical protein